MFKTCYKDGEDDDDMFKSVNNATLDLIPYWELDITR